MIHLFKNYYLAKFRQPIEKHQYFRIECFACRPYIVLGRWCLFSLGARI